MGDKAQMGAADILEAGAKFGLLRANPMEHGHSYGQTGAMMLVLAACLRWGALPEPHQVGSEKIGGAWSEGCAIAERMGFPLLSMLRAVNP